MNKTEAQFGRLVKAFQKQIESKCPSSSVRRFARRRFNVKFILRRPQLAALCPKLSAVSDVPFLRS